MYKKICICFSLFILLSCLITSRYAYSQEKEKFILAVFNLDAAGTSETEAKILTDKLIFHISNIIRLPEFKKTYGYEYELIERAEINKILDEFEFSQCVSDTCAIEFGKMLQAHRVVIGSVGLIGQTYNVSVRLIDVETAKQLAMANRDYKGAIDDLLSSVMENVVNDLLFFQEKIIEIKKEKIITKEIFEKTKQKKLFDFGLYPGYSYPLGFFAEKAYEGFSIAGEIFYRFSFLQNLNVGGRVAYNHFGASYTEVEEGAIYITTTSIKGSHSTIEILPTIRYLFEDNYSKLNFFAELGSGLYIFETDTKHTIKHEEGNAITWASMPEKHESETKFGICVGGGIKYKLSKSINVMAIPLYHIIMTDVENSTYLSFNIGVLF